MLQRLADSTGGRFYIAPSAKDLGEAFAQIERDLRTQYYISFPPQQSAPGYHSLRSRCERPRSWKSTRDRATTRWSNSGPSLQSAKNNRVYSSSVGGTVSSVGLQPGEQVHSRPAAPSALFGARPYVFSLILIVLSIGLYYPVKSHPFVNYDDNVYVTENVHVQSGLTWDTVTWAFVTYDAGNWHPLTWLSHALDFQMYDQEPAGHHQTSMLLHALNAVLLFWVLWRATGYPGRSFVVAALFAVHPINVESVAWISERKTVLSMMFFLLALGAYRWYVSKPKVGRYAVVALLFALGLMAKPQVITFPFVLLLWDYWPLRRMTIGKDACERSGLPAEEFSRAGGRKASAVRDRRCQRGHDDEGAERQWCGALAGVDATVDSTVERDCLVREVRREGVLADASRAHVSSPRKFSAGLAGLRRRC